MFPPLAAAGSTTPHPAIIGQAIAAGLTINPAAFGADREQVRLALAKQQIEARPVWKPLHLQPVFAGGEFIGDAVAEDLFEHGLCLPSGSNLTTEDLERVIHAISEIHCGTVQTH